MFSPTTQYYQRMHKSLGDKAKLLSYAQGASVVDMGSGDGALTAMMLEAGADAYGIDAASFSVETSAQLHPELHGRLFEAYAHEAAAVLPVTPDTIVASSILHEVYSYGTPETGSLSLEAHSQTIQAWFDLLPSGGRLLVRDGVIPANAAKFVNIRFKNSSRFENGKDMVAEYLNRIPFRGSGERQVNIFQTGDEEFSGDFHSVMEFLYTYTWGFSSYERETQELYGVLTLEGYLDKFEEVGFNVIHAEEYIQEGYITALENRVELRSGGEIINFPSSNSIMILEKP